MKLWTRLFAGCALLTQLSASAALKPESVFVAETKKTQFYVLDGLIVGGDRAINDVTVRDIRHSKNGAFERLVVDLEGTRNGEPAAIARPPYFQVAVTPDERRLVFTVWGRPKLGFDAKHVANAFRKSNVISGVQLLPRVEEDRWTFVVGLKTGRPVEIFELGDPVRIIVDIQLAERPRKK